MESGGRDSLTKFHKEKPFLEHVQNEIERCKRYQRPFSLLLIDLQTDPIDSKNFAQYTMIRQAAKVVRELTRKVDIPGRLGDKLALVIPESPRESAERMAERILGELGNVELLEEGLSLHVSGHVGIAVYPEDGATPKALVSAAERSLMTAPIKS